MKITGKRSHHVAADESIAGWYWSILRAHDAGVWNGEAAPCRGDGIHHLHHVRQNTPSSFPKMLAAERAPLPNRGGARTPSRLTPPAAQRFENGDLILNQRGVGGCDSRVRGDQRLFRDEQLETGQ